MRRRRFGHWALGELWQRGYDVNKLTSRLDRRRVYLCGSDFGPVVHRIIVKEVSQTPPPPPIISVTHVRADENER